VFEIGTSLRETRLRHGYELVEAEQATKIRAKYLRALEDERFELLPAQTYVKGFLRSYADYLGLDGQLYVDEYNSRYLADEDLTPRVRRPSTQSKAHRRVESSVLLIALAGIAAVTALVIVAWKWGGSEPTHIEGVGGRPAATRPAKQPAAAKAKKQWIAVELSAVKGNSRVAVYRGSSNGKLLYDGVVEQGDAKSFTGLRLWMLISEPENLLARVNGRRARLPGDGTKAIVAVASSKGITDARSA
jgi:Helix-turn-helix domain